MTAYFIKNGGNDAADGLSDANAWETVGKAITEINSGSIVGGDTVSLNGGDTWTETPTLDFGADYSANPLIINSYGTGFPTLINIQVGASNYRNIVFQVGCKGVTVDGIRFERNPDFERGSGIAILQHATTPSSHLTIQNCHFIGHRIALGAGRAPNVSYINNVIIDSQTQGFLTAGSDLLIEGNTFINCGYVGGGSDHSIYAGNNTQSGTWPVVSGVTIRDNLIINNSQPSEGSNSTVLVIHGKIDNILIEGNHLIEERGTPSSGGWGIAVDDGDSEPDVFNNVVIRRNLIEGCGNTGIHIDACKNVEVYENIIVSSGNQTNEAIRGITIENHSGGETTDGVEVYNNVTYAKSGTGTQTALNLDGAVLNVTRNENNVLVTYTEPLNFQLMSLPSKGALTAVGVDGSFTYEYEDGLANDTDTFTYKIFDTNGISNTATATIDIVGGATGNGYWGGGNDGSKSSEIDGIQFSNESAINPAATLAVARDELAGVSSSTDGYFGGGHTGSLSSEIDGIQFSDESAINPAATLSSGRRGVGACYSANDGYWAGGQGSSTEIDGIQFSDESAINPAAALAVGRLHLAGLQSSTDGFWAGGQGGLTEIDGIQFSDETAINPSATLNEQKREAAGVASETVGYWCGGDNATTVSDTIDSIQFSTETTSLIAATLSVAREGVAGAYSENNGYLGGGTTGTLSSEIDGLQFSDETAINPSATLSVARRAVAGVNYNP